MDTDRPDLEAQAVWQAIAASIPGTFGWTPRTAAPVYGGYLNYKWRVTGADRDRFVKYFHFRRYGPERLGPLEERLQRQRALESLGLPAPRIDAPQERILHFTPEGHAYMVMNAVRGATLSPGTATENQMRALGACAGQMHALTDAWSRVSEEILPTRANLLERVAAQRERIGGHAACAAILDRHVRMAQALPDDFLAETDIGWIHADFAADNVLLEGNAVTAVVDFDRNRYGLRGQDIGRILLSAGLGPQGLPKDKLAAFVEGYGRHRPLTRAGAVRALRIAWAVEMDYWIRPEILEGRDTGKPARFASEILWLGEQWDALDALGG